MPHKATIAPSLLLENLLYLPHLLRQVGIPVSVEQAGDLGVALSQVDLSQREQVYYAARAILICQPEHFRLFEMIFNRFWEFVSAPHRLRQQAPRVRPRQTQARQQLDIVGLMAQKALPAAKEIELEDKAGTFSQTERLQSKEFSAMTPAELAAVRQIMQAMQWTMSQRRTRRLIAHHRGKVLDQPRILRLAMKHHGLPLELLWRTRKIKQRPIVFIADISGSMEKYARLALQFFYSVTHQLNQVECFVFGTRLTRITHQLRVKNIDVALDEAARIVADWSGGTRIGASLQVFNHQWSRRVLRRGAVVVIVSDGWERGNATRLAQEMRYLQHRCHRLIWLNPLSGRQTYEPKVAGMAAALRYIDDFLPIHNLQSLSDFSEHLKQLK